MVNFIRYGKLFRIYEFIQPYLKYSTPLEDELPGKKALILAPHPDDEAIGCGGTIYKHIKSGGSAEVVFCTIDTDTRFKESLASSKAMGITNNHFLKYPVESLNKQKDLSERLLEIIQKVKPDILLLPFWFDNHSDHRAVNRALRTIGKKKSFDFMIYAYPVWFPLHPNVLIDIGDVWEEKKKIISCYKSQLATRDYIKMSYSLGQYWAEVKGGGLQVVESFFRATFKEYITLGKRFGI